LIIVFGEYLPKWNHTAIPCTEVFDCDAVPKHISEGELANLDRLTKDHNIENLASVKWNLSVPELYEETIKNNEAQVVANGPIVANTGQHPDRSPNDKFVTEESTTRDSIWWGKVNRPISEEQFDLDHHQMLVYLKGRNIYVRDRYAGADPCYRISVRVINQFAWHNMFINITYLLPVKVQNGRMKGCQRIFSLT